jgi:hypothetical protein
MSVSAVFVNIDVVTHFTNDFKIHFFGIFTIYQGVVDFLGKRRKNSKAKQKGNKCLFHVE